MNNEELKKLIENCKKKIKRHDSEVNELKNYLKGLEHALSIMTGFSVVSFVDAYDYRAGTDVEKMRRILELAVGPLHVNDILIKLGSPEKKASILSTLIKYSKNGKVFKHTGPATFTLKEENSD